MSDGVAENAPALLGTYRLQLTPEFGFDAARDALPYLRELGVSHLYLSPCLQAADGSEHGYDVTDPTCIDAARGGEEAFERLLLAAQDLGLGVLLDIVPNHMAASEQGPWWRDVLRCGAASRYAGHFDIDWSGGGTVAPGRLLLPILGDEPAREIERGHLRVDGDELLVYDRRLPLREAPAPGTPLATVLAAQHYELAYWRGGLRRLNWRRFFDVASLVGVRVEDPVVFAATHGKVLEYVERGLVQGLRIDHPDGLRDPVGYFRRLRAAAPDAWILVEKILEHDEQLPEDWPVDGTTGYDFMARATGLFVDASAERQMTELCRNVVGACPEFGEMQREKRRDALRRLFVPELRRVVGMLCEVAAARGLDGDEQTAQQVICAVLVEFPVYRSYTGESEPAAGASAEHVARAVRGAGRTVAGPLLDLLAAVLADDLGPGFGPGAETARELRARFQQLSGPVIAKGVEDTAMYCDRRLVALAEVGADPGQFGVSPAEFHAFCVRQAPRWSRTLLATSTHDTKRSGDLRLRMATLSEFADEWAITVQDWVTLNRRHRSGEMPDPGSEYLLYQTLVGVWPASVARIQAKMLKAVREAKEHTSWLDGRPEFEQSLQRFIEAVLGDAEFTGRVEAFVRQVLPVARIHSLAQTLVKATAPGVPDFYQGCEHWRESMVDPDNRREVDFERLRAVLEAVRGELPEEVMAEPDGGLAKLWLTQRVLALRAAHPGTFAPGAAYRPLSLAGPGKDHALAYLRESADRRHAVVVAVPRLARRALELAVGTTLQLPPGRWIDAWTGLPVALDPTDASRVGLDLLWQRFPAAALVRAD